jgi:hypothetical protein
MPRLESHEARQEKAESPRTIGGEARFASYCLASAASPGRLLRMYRRRRKVSHRFLIIIKINAEKLHRWVPLGNGLYSRTIAAGWAISFQSIKTRNKAASRLLQFLTVQNPYLKFLKSGARVLEDELRELIVNLVNFNAALVLLERYSLVQWSKLTDALSMHRLIQAELQEKILDLRIMFYGPRHVESLDANFQLCLTYCTQPRPGTVPNPVDGATAATKGFMEHAKAVNVPLMECMAIVYIHLTRSGAASEIEDTIRALSTTARVEYRRTTLDIMRNTAKTGVRVDRRFGTHIRAR